MLHITGNGELVTEYYPKIKSFLKDNTFDVFFITTDSNVFDILKGK
jgi:hypothetical protein